MGQGGQLGMTAGSPSFGGGPSEAGSAPVGGSPTVGGSPSVTGGSSSAGSPSVGGSPPAGGSPSVSGGSPSNGGSAPMAGAPAGGSGPAQAGAAMGGAQSGGVAGMDATAGSGGGQAPMDLKEIAKGLHGSLIVLPCQGGSGETCGTAKAGQGCPTNSDLFKAGVSTTNIMVDIGGTPGTPYTVKLRFQGIVENRTYTGAAAPEGDQSTMQTNGFYVGGAPQTGTGDYNIYALRVDNPKKDYFLNAIGNTSFNRHQSFVVDYEGSIKVVGGSKVQLLAQDTNCTAIRNCTDPPDNNQCTSSGVSNLAPEITQKIGGNGSAYNGQFVGITVLDVTSP